MQCSPKSAARGLSFAVAALIVSLGGTPRAHASDPSAFVSEILTPAGWELYGMWCSGVDELVSSAELRIPDGWGNPTSREEPRWGSFTCSEVVVPTEWRALSLQSP